MLLIFNLIGVAILAYLTYAEIRDTLIDRAEARKIQTPHE